MFVAFDPLLPFGLAVLFKAPPFIPTSSVGNLGRATYICPRNILQRSNLCAQAFPVRQLFMGRRRILSGSNNASPQPLSATVRAPTAISIMVRRGCKRRRAPGTFASVAAHNCANNVPCPASATVACVSRILESLLPGLQTVLAARLPLSRIWPTIARIIAAFLR